jgi:lycopene beta-cyclase
MTYFGFLLLFLGLPILALSWLTWRDRRAGRRLGAAFSTLPAFPVLLLHVLIALVYTTPWDNYLVATRVWWYDPALVTGLTIGWVPIEEYTFFVVQPLLTGLFLLWLARREPVRSRFRPRPALRWLPVAGGALVWLLMAVLLVAGYRPGTYLALELVWALPPILLQLLFGGDILWHHRRLVFLAIVPTTIYLSVADAIAIGSGTWTIDPAQSLQIYLGGILPVEEFVFFLLTNTLITFGMTLALAAHSGERLRHVRSRLARGRRAPAAPVEET